MQVFAVASYITAEHDAWLQSQPALGGCKSWTVCFNSATNCTDNPSCFHSPCDGFSETVSIAHNSLGYTFGGYVRELLYFSVAVIFCARFRISFLHLFVGPRAHPCLAVHVAG